jgi:6-phosphogluconolactonase
MMDLQTIYDASSDRLIELAAKNTFIAISAAWSTNSQANIVLTGGRTGAKIAAALSNEISDAIENFPEQVKGMKIHIWFSDERFVAGDNSERTDLAIMPELVNAASVLEIHQIANSSKSTLEQAASSYSAELTKILAGKKFDSVILSLGEDGHVASCFPGQDEIFNSSTAAIAVSNSPKPPAQRVSISLPALGQAAQIFLFGLGEGKLQAVKAAQENDAQAVVTKLRQNSQAGKMFLLTDRKD